MEINKVKAFSNLSVSKEKISKQFCSKQITFLLINVNENNIKIYARLTEPNKKFVQ